MSRVGRPKEHDAQTATALLEAAERAIEDQGIDSVSVRGVAADVGTSTRAVYSLFGSKEGLVAALAARAFDVLGTAVARLPRTDDPTADLVRAGLTFAGSRSITHRCSRSGCSAPKASPTNHGMLRMLPVSPLLACSKTD